MSIKLILDEIEVSIVNYEDKKRAVINCLKTGKGFSIRELRKCANKEVAVSEKTVSKILHELERMGVVINTSKKWYLVDYDYDVPITDSNLEEKRGNNVIRYFPSISIG